MKITKTVAIIPPNESMLMNAFGIKIANRAGVTQIIARAIFDDLLTLSRIDFNSPRPIPIAEVAIANRLNTLKNVSM